MSTLKYNKLILTHGAGSPVESEWFNNLSTCLQSKAIELVKFNFSYMEKIVETGVRRPPPKIDILIDEYLKVLSKFDEPVFIGGKSMGGRISTMLPKYINNESTPKILGNIVLGYPFHSISNPEKTRTQHLEKITVDTLIIQGENDKLGTKQEISGYNIDKDIKIYFIENGNHDLKVAKKHANKNETTFETISNEIYKFMEKVNNEKLL